MTSRDDGVESVAALTFIRKLATLVLQRDLQCQRGLAGQGFTAYACALCDRHCVHGTTATPLLCETCADDLLQIISPLGVPPTKDERPLNGANFREFAQRAIAAYYDKGRIVDALLWRAIVAHYELERGEWMRKVTGP
jgi:hypothetical protein